MNHLRYFYCVLFLIACHAVSAAEAPEKLFSDTIPPSIICPPSLTVTLDFLACDTVLNYMVNATDDQGLDTVTLLNGLPSGAPFLSGYTEVVWQATDQAGNTATCAFTVTVNELYTGLICKDSLDVFLDANCQLDLKPFDILNGTSYNCENLYDVFVSKVMPYDLNWGAPHFDNSDLNKTYPALVIYSYDNSHCFSQVTVRDGKAPEVTCLNGLSVNLLSPGTISLWAPDFLMHAQDNCTNNDYLKFGIRKAGTGSGFPLQPDGTPLTNIIFGCADVGNQL